MMNVDQRVVPGSHPNEDLVWTEGGTAIILDGATGLTDTQYTDAESDGRWYVETFADEIRDRIESDKSLTRIVRSSIQTVSDRFEEFTESTTIAKHEVPSAAGAIVRWDGEAVEYLILGDCSIVLKTVDGATPVLGKGPRELDNRVVERMEAIRAEATEPISYDELRERVDDMLIEHRRQMNEQGGYWTLGQTPEAVKYAQTDEIPQDSVEELIGFTDGFEGLVPTFDVFVDWERMLRYVSQNGLDRAIKTLRAYEQADPECRTYPRIKPSDDVGVVHVNFDG